MKRHLDAANVTNKEKVTNVDRCGGQVTIKIKNEQVRSDKKFLGS